MDSSFPAMEVLSMFVSRSSDWPSIFVFQNQRGFEGPVGGRKTGIFDGQIESGRVIQEGAKGQGGSFEPRYGWPKWALM